ncbi:helix-turn-helix domain-containing protein [Schinkia azotoformans]|uniref:helix-turn-helix domain-containing protein n=1 Tax=Schinkia azotoformans TaxID=1454 RepID=UPI002DBD9DF1|nr:helix-turn-helix domain-containing protein [Schinkia azotoformans]MEC1716662.1 helix-turn-helix domain-containing protein [Schinkia azotoformans]MEC1739501.1 helix-turn-helix domain-containing protein [Schinkia azotoformans]MEC1745429.1 helix-turn-helix domain-containing protein [Schinkia azotoformans]MEC1756492.1 helix-turn-helix domain-containing protein [Schinkia azotoformans]MEC1765759.1 helix-turn-helix domain-containing protein [Schinkia azotoformans]
MSELAFRIKSLREKSGFSQKRVAEALRISNVQLSRYESGDRKPEPEMVAAIANFFEVTTDYLLGLTDDPKGYKAIEDLFLGGQTFPEYKQNVDKLILRKKGQTPFKKIGLLIDEQRVSRKISRSELAQKLGITMPQLNDILFGHTAPTESQAVTLSEIFNVEKSHYLPNQEKDYNPLEEINKIIKNLGLEEGASGFFDIEKWKQFGPEDVEEIRRHFEWVAHKAKEKKYNPDENDTDGLE